MIEIMINIFCKPAQVVCAKLSSQGFVSIKQLSVVLHSFLQSSVFRKDEPEYSTSSAYFKNSPRLVFIPLSHVTLQLLQSLHCPTSQKGVTVTQFE